MENKEKLFMKTYMEVIQKYIALNKQIVANQFIGYTHSEIEMLVKVGELNEPTVTQLANETGMTRGGVTKLMNRLEHKELVEVFQKPNNNKEKHFVLNEKGMTLYEQHEELFEKFYVRDKKIFDTLSKDELNKAISFGNQLIEHFDDEVR